MNYKDILLLKKSVNFIDTNNYDINGITVLKRLEKKQAKLSYYIDKDIIKKNNKVKSVK